MDSLKNFLKKIREKIVNWFKNSVFYKFYCKHKMAFIFIFFFLFIIWFIYVNTKKFFHFDIFFGTIITILIIFSIALAHYLIIYYYFKRKPQFFEVLFLVSKTCTFFLCFIIFYEFLINNNFINLSFLDFFIIIITLPISAKRLTYQSSLENFLEKNLSSILKKSSELLLNLFKNLNFISFHKYLCKTSMAALPITAINNDSNSNSSSTNFLPHYSDKLQSMLLERNNIEKYKVLISEKLKYCIFNPSDHKYISSLKDRGLSLYALEVVNKTNKIIIEKLKDSKLISFDLAKEVAIKIIHNVDKPTLKKMIMYNVSNDLRDHSYFFNVPQFIEVVSLVSFYRLLDDKSLIMIVNNYTGPVFGDLCNGLVKIKTLRIRGIEIFTKISKDSIQNVMETQSLKSDNKYGIKVFLHDSVRYTIDSFHINKIINFKNDPLNFIKIIQTFKAKNIELIKNGNSPLFKELERDLIFNLINLQYILLNLERFKSQNGHLIIEIRHMFNANFSPEDFESMQSITNSVNKLNLGNWFDRKVVDKNMSVKDLIQYKDLFKVIPLIEKINNQGWNLNQNREKLDSIFKIIYCLPQSQFENFKNLLVTFDYMAKTEVVERFNMLNLNTLENNKEEYEKEIKSLFPEELSNLNIKNETEKNQNLVDFTHYPDEKIDFIKRAQKINPDFNPTKAFREYSNKSQYIIRLEDLDKFNKICK